MYCMGQILLGGGSGGRSSFHCARWSFSYLPDKPPWDPELVFVDGRYISSDTWYDADGTVFQPQVHYFVGGATKLYGAALYRLRPEDFEPQPIDVGVHQARPDEQ